VGLASAIFFWPLFFVVTILLAITIVGCVLFLLYPFLFLYLGLLVLLGYTAVAYRVGRLLEGRFDRRPGSPYASLDTCRYEVREAENLMQHHRIPTLDTTSKSIEEIATTILHRAKLERHTY
jgi:regulator of PEP synthase PpsR (kinase-PPPase family)